MNDRLAWFGMMWLAVACCRCTNDDAYASPRPAPKVDAGSRHDVRAVADAGRAVSPADAGRVKAKPKVRASSDAASTDEVIGLTRAQLMARRGPPTKKRGLEWVYTPDQPGCRDMIISEVFTFKRNVVASFRLDSVQTHQVCRGPGPGPGGF